MSIFVRVAILLQVAIRVAMKKILSPPVKPAHRRLFGDRVAMVAINTYLALNKIKTIDPCSRLAIELDRWEANRDIN
jgi:hypothetical protein